MRHVEIDYSWFGLTLVISAKATPGHPAYISGPPEDCYPEEGPEIEIEGCKVGGEEFDYFDIVYCPSINDRRVDLEEELLDAVYNYLMEEEVL